MYCGICQGEEWPKGLTTIDIEDFHEEERKMPICEQCNDSKDRKLYGSHGKQVCGTCQSIRGNVKNRPDIVMDVIRELHPELLSHGKEEPSKLHREMIAKLNEQLEEEKQRNKLLSDENIVTLEDLEKALASQTLVNHPGPWKKFALGLINNGSVSDVTAEDLRALQRAT